MYDELTQVDIDKMNEEIAYRKTVLRPKLIEDVQTARAFGDLSENYEYKCAKQAKNRNDSRIRYLERMVATAKVIDSCGADNGAVALFSKVTLLNEKLQKEQTIRIVTTPCGRTRSKALSAKSPPWAGRCWATGPATGWRSPLTPKMKYTVVIRSVEPGEDDASLDISAY